MSDLSNHSNMQVEKVLHLHMLNDIPMTMHSPILAACLTARSTYCPVQSATVNSVTQLTYNTEKRGGRWGDEAEELRVVPATFTTVHINVLHDLQSNIYSMCSYVVYMLLRTPCSYLLQLILCSIPLRTSSNSGTH